MALRLSEPGALSSSSLGSVYLLAYHRPFCAEIEARMQVDFEAFYRSSSGAMQLLVYNPYLPFPLPPVEVRAMWRAMAATHPRVDGAALVGRGATGLAAAVFASMVEHIVWPVTRVRLRVCNDPDEAVEWLCRELATGVDPAELAERFQEVRSPPWAAK